MRKDILEGVQLHLMNHTKPNYAAMAKQYNCDYRTVKRYYEAGIEGKLKEAKERRNSTPPMLNGFEAIIKEKLQLNCSAKSIFYFLQKKGYSGSYTTVKRYCRAYKEKKKKKATIRVETTPGLSAQVDWKENVKMVSRHGEVFYINLFLYVLGYSRMKYVEVTLDRKQATVFQCLIHAFQACGEGVPQEIWFDNMKTVVDRSRSQFNQTVFNERFRQFAKDAGFQPIACRPFRPQTKGKVEALARTVEQLFVFNYEFEDEKELKRIVSEFVHDLNNSISQATLEQPTLRLKEEKPVLLPLDVQRLASYLAKPDTFKRIVSKESMILYQNAKYSVPVDYIGMQVEVRVMNGRLAIFAGGNCIRTHPLSTKRFNYQREDSIGILRSDVFQYLEDSELERFVDENLDAYDTL
jgi:transposase